MKIEIRDCDIEELFEILCKIDMEMDYYGNLERPAGIDDILDQLCEFDEDEYEEILDEWLETDYSETDSIRFNEMYIGKFKPKCDHYFTEEVSDYSTNVTFEHNGMTYNKITIFKCCDCGEFIERVEKNIGWIRNNYDSQPFCLKGLLF